MHAPGKATLEKKQILIYEQNNDIISMINNKNYLILPKQKKSTVTLQYVIILSSDNFRDNF